MTSFSRRSSLNALQAAMVKRLAPWAQKVVEDSMARYVGKSTGRFTVAEYEKARWVYSNRNL